MLTWFRTGRTAAAGVLACGLLFVVHLVWFAVGWGSPETRSLVTDGTYLPLAVAYTIFGIRVAFSPRQGSRRRASKRRSRRPP
jgi:hypothetical protein